MIQVKMGNTWFTLTRSQCRRTHKSLKVHSIHGAQFEYNNLNYWIALLLLHS